MLNKIRFNYRESENQAGLFTPYHTLFTCEIKHNGKQYTFKYQCNTDITTPNKNNCIECLILDSDAYDNSRDILDFANEYGCTSEREARRAYKACRRTYNALHRLFTDYELETLYNEINGEYISIDDLTQAAEAITA